MRTFNQRGFSLVEVLIAAGILGIVVTGVTTMVGGNAVNDVFRARTQAGNVCLAEANRMMNKIKEKGLVRNRINLAVPESATALGGDLTVTSGNYSGSNFEPGIAYANRWSTALPIYETPVSGVYQIRPHMEIMGYMNALQALYNSAKTTFCPTTATAFGATSYVGDGTASNGLWYDVATSTELDKLGSTTQPATAYLKIQPFNTTTGAIIACASAPATLDIRPAHDPATALLPSVPKSDTMYTDNTNNDSTAINIVRYAGGVGVKNSPGSVAVFKDPATTATVDDRGFVVTVTVVFKDRNGEDRNCAVQEKFQYSSQAPNSLHLEFSDIEDGPDANTTITTPDANETADDSNEPENINRTLRVGVAGNTRPIYPAKFPGAPELAADYSNNVLTPTNTLIYGCNETTNYSRDINLRLKNVRPGSIMMCRNMSRLRTAPPGYGTAVQYMHLDNYPQRTLFYSTELLQNDYFRSKEVADGVYGDMMVMGLYYPESMAGVNGRYYCRSADGCDDLPRFPQGYAPPATGYNWATYTSAGDTTRLIYPLTTNEASAADITTDYVPCETIDVCNDGSTAHPPSFAGFVPQNSGAKTGVDAYHLQFLNLPVGCEVNIHMVEVDAGYNTKATIFKEYIHEKVPGNKLCRAGFNGAGYNYIPGHNNFEWFFACTSTNPVNDAAAAVQNCAAAGPRSDPHVPCCVDFPFYPPDAISGDAPHNDGIYDP